MKALRWSGASLLGLLGGLLGLVGVILCATLILLPLGIPVVMLARRLFKTAGQLVVPKPVRHPVEQLKDSSSGSARSAWRSLRGGGSKASASAADGAATVSSGARSATSKAVSAAASKVRPSRTTRLRRRLHLA
jgi:hypothetical protein